ncbi:hypothetical protein [Burkholderia ambifaria]|uniref:hypothetical protein n=1 Tax=Burkholderia ambifaria TaxID=152480 RepID=UPI001589419F|nr:hypothetical protein [Burkholderia ambifaria]
MTSTLVIVTVAKKVLPWQPIFMPSCLSSDRASSEACPFLPIAQTGSSWRETSNTYGNTTTINGTAANGQSWNETIQNFGNGNRSMSGMDSNGNFFSRTCTRYGCN